MFETIEAGFLALYGPLNNDEQRELYQRVFRIFVARDYSFTTSGVRWDDNTFVVSFEIHEVLWRLFLAIERGVSVTDIDPVDIPQFTANWYERVPGIFKKYGKTIDNGQAKIFYSVMLAISTLRDEKNLHIFVSGSGRTDQGWSYSAAAEYLSKRGCSGRFELWDLLTETKNSQVGNFAMDYHQGYVPAIPETATHVLDDTWPCVLKPQEIKKAVDRGVVITAKIVLNAVVSGSVMRARLPARIFTQPFHSGWERRIVYNYRAPKTGVPVVGCTCSDCLKRQEHFIGEEGEHHIFGMGVKPCFPVPGYNLLRECYPFKAGLVQDYGLAMARVPFAALKRFRQYGIMRSMFIRFILQLN